MEGLISIFTESVFIQNMALHVYLFGYIQKG